MPQPNDADLKFFGKYKLHTGQKWRTNNFGDVVINKVNSSKDVSVTFLDTGNERSVTTSSLVAGEVKDKLHGVGYNSKSKYTAARQLCYDYWKTMIMRAYCPVYTKDHPTYEGVSVCVDWLDYQNFAKWYYTLNYVVKGYNLDKDLLSVDNKEYNPENCCFLPQEVNKSITIKSGLRGFQYHKRDDCYETQYRSVYLGRSTEFTLDQLQSIYIKERHSFVRNFAEEYQYKLPEEVLVVLRNYEVVVNNQGFIERVK